MKENSEPIKPKVGELTSPNDHWVPVKFGDTCTRWVLCRNVSELEPVFDMHGRDVLAGLILISPYDEAAHGGSTFWDLIDQADYLPDDMIEARDEAWFYFHWHHYVFNEVVTFPQGRLTLDIDPFKDHCARFLKNISEAYEKEEAT